MMSEMKCPKRRSQRKITFFINRETNNKQKITFFPFTCKPRIALEPQWLYIELAEVGMTIKRRCPFSKPVFVQYPSVPYRNSAHLKFFERRTFFGRVESLLRCEYTRGLAEHVSLKYSLMSIHLVSAKSC